MTQHQHPPERRSFRARAIAVALFMAGAFTLVVAGACGNDDGLVGGDCASGYTQFGDSCINLKTDPANCGIFGRVCGSGVECILGFCGGPEAGQDEDGSADAQDDGSDYGEASARRDGGRRDGSGDDGSSEDGSTFDDGSSDDGNPNKSDGSPIDGTVGDGNPTDGSPTDGTVGDGNPNNNPEGSPGDGSPNDGSLEDSDTDACVPPYDTPANCGACGRACLDPEDTCGFVDGGYGCVPLCTLPLVDCSHECVDLTRDPNNCGSCGHVCVSQYCVLSECQGSITGNIMVIGHDFLATAPSDQQAKLLENSVFYNNATSMEVLSFEHYANPSAVASGKNILSTYASDHSISLVLEPVFDDTLIGKGVPIANVGVVIVWDQPNAPAGKMGALGTSWASSLATFTQAGGIVISLDAADGVAEMPAFETNAALLAVTSHAVVAPGTPAAVPAAGLSIATGMTNVYLVEADTASFTTTEPASLRLIDVANVQDAGTALLAVHKIVTN